MRYSCAKTVEIPLYTVGKNYFPDLQILAGKKIQAINITAGVKLLSGAPEISNNNDLKNIFLSLTEDGTFYYINEISCDHFDYNNVQGKNISIDRCINVMACYIDNQSVDLVGRSVLVTIWYENSQYTRAITSDNTNRESFDVLVDRTNYRNYLPDNRTLFDKSFRGFTVTYPTKTPNFHDGVAANVANERFYLSLVKGSFAVIDQLPIALLQQVTWFEPQNFANIIFDFESSFVEVAGSDALTPAYLVITAKFQR